MKNFLKAKNKDIKNENKKDGYSILSFNKCFLTKLEKQLNNNANKLYNLMYVSSRQPISLIPANYNPAEVKHRMEIEDALCNEGLIAIKLENDNNFNQSSIFNIEKKMIHREQRYMFFKINKEQVILCPDNKDQIEMIETIVANEVLTTKNNDDKNFDYSNKFGQQDVSEKEEQLLKRELEEELINEEYIGDNILAQRLLSTTDPLVKIKLDRKFHHDFESMLLMLNINYAMLNNTFVFTKKDFQQISTHVTSLISGDLIIKEDAIYDKSLNIVIENPHEFSKEPNIDLLIKTHDKPKEINEMENELQIL